MFSDCLMILNVEVDELDIEEAIDGHVVRCPVHFDHETLQDVVEPVKS